MVITVHAAYGYTPLNRTYCSCQSFAQSNVSTLLKEHAESEV